ncbi:hypothetical protein K469DRAFT_451272, partial [Zopfia rhizophila CBS 207.26]
AETTRRELSPATRGYIIGALEAGASAAQVATSKSLKPDTVRLTYRKRDDKPHQESRPRSGGLKSYSIRDERRVVRFVRANPKATWKSTMAGPNLDFSKRTYQSICEAYNITN